jgi:hypothetical protein
MVPVLMEISGTLHQSAFTDEESALAAAEKKILTDKRHKK